MTFKILGTDTFESEPVEFEIATTENWDKAVEAAHTLAAPFFRVRIVDADGNEVYCAN